MKLCFTLAAFKHRSTAVHQRVFSSIWVFLSFVLKESLLLLAMPQGMRELISQTPGHLRPL